MITTQIICDCFLRLSKRPAIKFLQQSKAVTSPAVITVESTITIFVVESKSIFAAADRTRIMSPFEMF